MYDLLFLVPQERNQNLKASILRVMYLVRGQAVSLLCSVIMTAHRQDPSHPRRRVHACERTWRSGELVYTAHIYMTCVNMEDFWKSAKNLLGVHASGKWG